MRRSFKNLAGTESAAEFLRTLRLHGQQRPIAPDDYADILGVESLHAGLFTQDDAQFRETVKERPRI